MPKGEGHIERVVGIVLVLSKSLLKIRQCLVVMAQAQFHHAKIVEGLSEWSNPDQFFQVNFGRSVLAQVIFVNSEDEESFRIVAITRTQVSEPFGRCRVIILIQIKLAKRKRRTVIIGI